MTRRRSIAIAGVSLAVLAAGVWLWTALRHRGLPRVGSDAYEQTVRHFYRGLAALEVGLIDDSTREFTAATTLAPGEPAGWADLGLAHLRLGEFDAAAAAVEQARALAPSSGDIAFLLGRLETARGDRDRGLADLRRAVSLNPRDLQARTAVIEEVENGGGPTADADAARLVDELAALAPGNVAVLVERARLAAKRGDGAALNEALDRLGPAAATWPPDVADQYRAVRQAAAAANFPDASRAMAFLRNVLAQVPAYLDARRQVTPSAELIADPLTTFVRLPVPLATPSPEDTALSFTREALTAPGAASADARTLVTVPLTDTATAIFAASARGIQRLDAPSPALPFPGGASGADPGPNSLLAADWNNDFRMDLVAAGAGGIRLFLQSSDGGFEDATASLALTPAAAAVDATGVWAADIEMDGDLDLVVAARSGPPLLIRNNGDGTAAASPIFAGVVGVRGFAWGDLDRDGDPDAALLGADGRVQVFANMQAGHFEPMPALPVGPPRVAMALADLDADGVLDLVTLDGGGNLRRASWSLDRWHDDQVAAGGPVPSGGAPAEVRLAIDDLDNNGAVDVLAANGANTAIWLADSTRALRPWLGTLDASVMSVLDLTRDGQLDLVGLDGGRPYRFAGRGTRGYHYQIVRPRAQDAAGDQRINSFGIGGDIEVRSGRLVQKQPIAAAVLHFGLGTRTAIDVTRIVWPNGVPQAEFDPRVDEPLVAAQRLKGSCPWVFADDGTGMHFVTDFLWRSPLGLRINAQDTAGTTQTEDWVKIRGDQLAARHGAYDVRISAELWETHFIDAVSLLVVDHPEDTAVFVDERFSREAPALRVEAMRPPRPVAGAWDDTGRDVTDLVSRRDGRYLSTFARGRYQGIAADHFVEFDTGGVVPTDRPAWLVAEGWIYPTDSSINVAIGQGRVVQPHGLSLEARDARGRWVVVAPDLGFPAGKNKTILIDLRRAARAGVSGATRFRLRTNLEIYWDALEVAEGVDDAALRTRRVAASTADLRYRGFSETRTGGRDQPETPVYDRIANTAPRWRDLVGYYTRYGDVRELVASVEDRYVIMNAGDELRLSFAAPPPPPAGWARDFVLMGDGWEKDGDFNTGYSKTVLPLPSHDRPAYVSASATPVLGDDPVYRRYPADWETYHTRLVSPGRFLDGLVWPERPDRP